MTRLLILLSIVFTLDFLGHFLLWRGWVKRPAWASSKLRGALTGFLVTMAILLPLGLILSRSLPRAFAQPLAYVSLGWLGLFFYAVVWMGLVDLTLVGARIFAKLRGQPPVDPERRKLLHQGAAVVAGAGTVGVGLVGLRGGLGEVEVKEVGVRLERLPAALSGLSLVQLSDVHIGPTLGKRFLEGIVEHANRARPDAVVITGDLVDGSVAELREHVAPLAKLKSRWGTYFITGNHEYYSGAEEWVAHLRELGIRVLVNERTQLGDAQKIDLIGVNDWSVYAPHEPALTQSLARGLDPDRERILLAHQPRSIPVAEALDVGLQISGHTHGGQIYPFTELVRLTTPYVAGLYEHDVRSQIYVSRGTGYWGPRCGWGRRPR